MSSYSDSRQSINKFGTTAPHPRISLLVHDSASQEERELDLCIKHCFITASVIFLVVLGRRELVFPLLTISCYNATTFLLIMCSLCDSRLLFVNLGRRSRFYAWY